MSVNNYISMSPLLFGQHLEKLAQTGNKLDQDILINEIAKRLPKLHSLITYSENFIGIPCGDSRVPEKLAKCMTKYLSEASLTEQQAVKCLNAIDKAVEDRRHTVCPPAKQKVFSYYNEPYSTDFILKYLEKMRTQVLLNEHPDVPVKINSELDKLDQSVSEQFQNQINKTRDMFNLNSSQVKHFEVLENRYRKTSICAAVTAVTMAIFIALALLPLPFLAPLVAIAALGVWSRVSANKIPNKIKESTKIFRNALAELDKCAKHYHQFKANFREEGFKTFYEKLSPEEKSSIDIMNWNSLSLLSF